MRPENNRKEVLFGRVLRNRCPILQTEMGQFGRKLIHIYKKLFEGMIVTIRDDRADPRRSYRFATIEARFVAI